LNLPSSTSNEHPLNLAWPTPSSQKSLRGFLSLTGFYRRFIKDYAKLAFHVTSLLRRDYFQWSFDAQMAFEALKRAMTRAPVLALPDFTSPFFVETDASGFGMGAVLSQHDHPIAYFSKQFCPKLLRSSTYIRELHAITTAVKRWCQFLLGHPFFILTDHHSLKDLMNQAIQTSEQHVYSAKLLRYDYTIKYKAGKHNFVADALSRIHNPDMASAHWILSIPQFQFLDDLKKELATLEEFNTLCQQISMSPDSYQDYKTVNSLILHKGRIWVPKSCSFIPLLLAEFHASPLGGHMGVAKTLSRLSANFIWPGMRKDVQRFISECSTCLQTKYIAQKTTGLLQPIPPPSAPWEDLALDFITGLPSSSGFSVILVVVDRFTKGAHFGTLPAHFTASKVAQLFLDMVCKLHGFPKSLISDRDPIFISHFW